jgi:tRNA A58 N-methylase Trm61
MPIEAADVAKAKEMLRDMPASDLTALTTIAEVLAFTIESARADGDCELEAIEFAARVADLTRDERRSAASTLKKLGYRAAADRLRSFKKLV